MLAHRSPASLRVVGAAKQPPQHRPSRALRSEAAEEEAKQQQRNANIDRDNLSAVSRSAHSVQIFVKTLTGKTIALDAVLDDDVAAFHRLVEEREGVPVDQQRLIFSGKQLESGHTLRECGVAKEATLYLVLRLRGGADEDRRRYQIAQRVLMDVTYVRLRERFKELWDAKYGPYPGHTCHWADDAVHGELVANGLAVTVKLEGKATVNSHGKVIDREFIAVDDTLFGALQSLNQRR